MKTSVLKFLGGLGSVISNRKVQGLVATGIVGKFIIMPEVYKSIDSYNTNMGIVTRLQKDFSEKTTELAANIESVKDRVVDYGTFVEASNKEVDEALKDAQQTTRLNRFLNHVNPFLSHLP